MRFAFNWVEQQDVFCALATLSWLVSILKVAERCHHSLAPGTRRCPPLGDWGLPLKRINKCVHVSHLPLLGFSDPVSPLTAPVANIGVWAGTWDSLGPSETGGLFDAMAWNATFKEPFDALMRNLVTMLIGFVCAEVKVDGRLMDGKEEVK
ncbi:uncharacterized protein N7515_004762 [Penicillium bovifimosum]|uniref:Uncharacterized protein n=1 Tax=Penicillium bovifimosum TaxID=126998 RepID=A0A9W9H0R7_9EURO|nr:uncharacterized protein N7515_004762 [Penicillium bovifimosum]KAJ5135484.1 hypothetical protein N7515_004762 [Penicillium bovifimosum]